ncbi:MAG TPA: acyl carrier protein [Thermotogota bacterium]|nr:acyl carrier protein [Thermotogota bacterium]
MEIVNIIEEALELQKDTITLDTLLEGLEQWDSLGMISVKDEIETRMGSSIPMTELKACKTIRDIENIIRVKEETKK